MSCLTRFIGAITVLAPAGPSLAAQTPVPVHQEPRHHLVWEDESVRVLDVRVPPGDTSLYHIHDAAILYVPINVSPTDAQALGGRWSGVGPTDTSRFSPGTVATDTQYAARPLTHRVANVGPGLFRLIAIVNGGPGDGGPADATLPGRLEASSSWFRQSRLTLAADASTGWYASPDPLVVVQVSAAGAAVERQSESSALKGPGAWAYLPAGARFRIRSRDGESTLVLVQVR